MYFIYFVTALLLSIGMFPLPIEFYSYLRIAVSLGCVFGIIDFFKNAEEPVKWKMIIFFLFFLIMYNPIIPFYFKNKISWIVLDLLAIPIFTVVAFLKFKESKTKPDLKRSRKL